MKKRLKYFIMIPVWIIAGIVAVVFSLTVVCIFLHAGADLKDPGHEPVPGNAEIMDSLRVWHGNSLRLNKYGHWEMKVAGSPYERGDAIGKLAPDLLYYQEHVFVDRLYEMVPVSRYRQFLCYFINIFNRHLGNSVPLEIRQEIKAMSSACTHEFDEFGTPYERQMQYHSAHDIGHVMQDYMLVGCSSFAVWGSESADSSLLVGRNFDFYMGDDFSRNKLVLFERPDSGYAFVSVTWPGMLGVLSGMNTEGLTVSINAAKLETPKMSATPISILSRLILQYASTIDEAWKIARAYRTFVSESILIGSVKDGRAAIIEKTPSEIALYDPAATERIICTNHYQSDLFRNRAANLDNIRMSDSMQRYKRVEELLDSSGAMTPAKAASVLRDMKGLSGEPLGYGNELSINQLLAMHSVIFKPADKRIWVSTSPWQLGQFVCYDLDNVFGADSLASFSVPQLTIPADPFVHTDAFADFMKFKSMLPVIHLAIENKRIIPQDSIKMFVNLNPLYFNAYNLAGDYCASIGDLNQACNHWKKSLSLEMKPKERLQIEKKLANAFERHD